MKWSESNEDIAEVLAALGRYIDLDQIMLVGRGVGIFIKKNTGQARQLGRRGTSILR
ncbi:hypothetical protein [uncultured Corynebacterium sp.]|uniref:hypothetical protein n=1 Tax=uncultured Corynebacterium sp. TaxID=159447 RepID=UPI002888F9FC|nr:hypothetical protein [uncultured Corynebacterium sp.]